MSSDRPPIIDIAPGENHIALRYPDKCFYVPQVFHSSSTYGIVAPLLINDIHESPLLETIYGPSANYARDTIIINNHPIRRVKIFGKIVGERYKDFGFGNKANHVMVTIDDSSSATRSQISVKIEESKYISKGFKFGHNYGKLIEICGMCTLYFGEREIRSDFVNILGNEDDIHIEVEEWKSRLQFRREVLSIPWEYNPDATVIEGENFTDEVRFDRDESIRRLNRERLQLGTNNLNQIPDLTREDSIITNHIRFQERLEELMEIDEEDIVEVEEVEGTMKVPATSNSIVSQAKSQDIVEEISQMDDDEREEAIQELRAEEFQQAMEKSHKRKPILSARIFEEREEEDVRIIDIKDASIHIITEFQLVMEFLKYIIKQDFRTFQLVDIYKDATYFDHLTNFVRLQIAFIHLNDSNRSSQKRTTMRFQQEILFHKIRHTLQVDYKLIAVTKSQKVKAKTFHKIYHELTEILNELVGQTVGYLNVSRYLRSVQSRYGVGETFPYKALNSIIDHIITEVFHDRVHWKYDSRLQLWHYRRDIA